jgi:hypothetical protein
MAGLSVRSLGGDAKEGPPPAPAGDGVPRAGSEDGKIIVLHHQRPLVLLPREETMLEIRPLPEPGATANRDPAVARVIASLQPPLARLPTAQRLADLAAAGVRLEPGRSYLLSAGADTLRVDVARDAGAGPELPLARLVSF